MGFILVVLLFWGISCTSKDKDTTWVLKRSLSLSYSSVLLVHLFLGSLILFSLDPELPDELITIANWL